MIVDNGKYYLYRHIRNDSGEPFYVGIGKKRENKNFKTHYGEYQRAHDRNRRNPYWKAVAAKSGYEIEILLETNDKEFVFEKEIEFIKLYGRGDLGTGGLSNLCSGGAHPYGEMTRKRVVFDSKNAFLYDSKTGNFIKEFTKLQDVCKYTNTKNNRIGTICKNKSSYKGFIFSFEYMGEKVTPSNFLVRVPNGVKKPIYKIDIYDGNAIKSYKSISEAARRNGVHLAAISAAIIKKTNCIGFYWSCEENINVSEYYSGVKEVCKICPKTFTILKTYSSMSESEREEQICDGGISFLVKNKSIRNGYGYCLYSELDNIKLSDFRKPNTREIVSINEIDNSKKHYKKLRDAARELNINSGRICEALKLGKTLNGCKWTYLN